MKPEPILTKHTYYVVLLKSGLLLTRGFGPLGVTKLVDASLFDSKEQAADHIKWMKALSCEWLNALKECRYKPVHARLELY